MTKALTRGLLELSVACLLAFPDVALAQSKSPSALAPAAAAAAAWDPSLPGKWTYRSYVNRAEVMVWDAPTSQAVLDIAGLFGQGSTAPNAAKALSLVFGEGVMAFDPPKGNNITGTLDMGGGLVLDLKGTMQTSAAGDISVDLIGTGRDNTPTANWEYDYKATTAPKWPNGVNQIPTLVGTVIRAKPHDGGAAGVTASFISIKR